MTKEREIEMLRDMLALNLSQFNKLLDLVGRYLDAVVLDVGAYPEADRINEVRRAIAAELERQAAELGVDVEGAR